MTVARRFLICMIFSPDRRVTGSSCSYIIFRDADPDDYVLRAHLLG